MRKRIQYRVCSCTPANGIVQIESRLLVTMVNREMRRIKCMQDLRRKAHRAMNLGDVCFHSWHPWWAIKVYLWTSRHIGNRDWDEWLHAEWSDSWYWIEDMTAEMEARELGRHADDVWRWLGHSEMAWMENAARADYQMLFMVKYNADGDCFDEIVDTRDPSIAIFNEGLPDWNPLFTQSIYVQ